MLVICKNFQCILLRASGMGRLVHETAENLCLPQDIQTHMLPLTTLILNEEI